MASVNDVGVPGQPMNNPPLTPWQTAVKAAFNSSDVTVDARVAAHAAAANPHNQYVRGTGLRLFTTNASLGTIVGGSTSIEAVVSLAAAGFTSVPVVIATPATPFGTVTWAVSFSNTTATQVTIRAQGAASPGSSSFTVNVIAVGGVAATLLPADDQPT
jgi:hypothetical protein